MFSISLVIRIATLSMADTYTWMAGSRNSTLQISGKNITHETFSDVGCPEESWYYNPHGLWTCTL